MAPIVRDEYAALIDDTLMAVHAANAPDRLDREALALLEAQLRRVQEAAAATNLVRVANIAGQLQRLLVALKDEEPTVRHAGTVRRGLDVLTLLAQDAERQIEGHPAAALDDAVDCFVDQVERTVRGERGARIMRFPQFRSRAAASKARGSWSTPTGTT